MTLRKPVRRLLVSAVAAVAASVVGVPAAVAAPPDPAVVETYTEGHPEPVSATDSDTMATTGLVTDASTVEKVYGIPALNQERFQDFADDQDYVVDVRPTNPDAVHWLAEGGLPKPPFLKSKTINDIDVSLGAPNGMQGTVGFFEPVLPDRNGRSDADWKPITDRYIQRWNEYQELEPKMRELDDNGTIVINDGVVYGYDDADQLRPFTGDHDVFDIRTTDGERLSQTRYDDAVAEMRARDMGVEHGAHMYWEPTTDFEHDIYQRIVDAHRPGGEPLVRFTPDEPVKLVYSTTPVAD